MIVFIIDREERIENIIIVGKGEIAVDHHFLFVLQCLQKPFSLSFLETRDRVAKGRLSDSVFLLFVSQLRDGGM